MSLGDNEDYIYDENIRKASEGHVNEVTHRCSFISSSSPEELRQEITKMSEKKAKELFNTEEERKVWIDSIRKSVEQSLQTQVRAVLGTPNSQKKRLLHKKVPEESQNNDHNSYRNRILKAKEPRYSYLKDSKDHFKFDRDKLRYSLTHDLETALSSQSSCMDPLLDDYNKHFSPYTRAALENVSLSNTTYCSRRLPEPHFKRAPGEKWIDSQGIEHEFPGPFWPKDHFPIFSNQKHIKNVPYAPEPLNATGTRGIIREEDPSLFPKPWKGTTIVYDRSNIKLAPSAPSGCFPNLKFESRFECGNLQQAKRVGRCEYDLTLTTDLYTRRHTQWYYFRLENMVAGVTYKFNIVNLLKRDSLYNYGMKPLLYSQKLEHDSNIGWRRTGHSINYSKNISHKNVLLSKELSYYVLTFQMEFPCSKDVCYLAHCYPYSYSDLDQYLRALVDSPTTSQHVRKEVLCKTLAGNNCHALTITSSQVPDNEKLGVVISARVHPGETNASWMMKGVMDFLTSTDAVAESLRRKFVFKIVPMLNPDGVIVGNYRTNLAAKDLNRTYKEPDKANFPTVWHTKAMLESFKENHEVIIYCDLHGHSRKPNVFMYGCTADPSMGSVSNFLEERLFPWMMSQKAPDKFSFQGCKFIVRKCKESTARVVMWRQLGIPNSFTMEATFCGTNFGDLERGRHFNTRDFEDMGRHFCEVLLEYSEAKSANRNEMTKAFVELACKMTRDILKQSIGSFKQPCDSNNNQTTKPNENKPNEKSEQLQLGKLQFVSSTSRGLKVAPKPRDVNFVDVDVRRADCEQNETSKSGGEYQVAVKSIHVDSFNDCIKILEGLGLTKCYEESDSSDSDSEPEDELSPCKGQNVTKRKKKKKKRKQNWWETLSKTTIPETSKNNVMEEEQAKTVERRVKIGFGKFVNPYTNRSNNGIPVFSQERILERARKKEVEKEAEEREKAESQQTTDASSSGESVLAFTDDTELNFVTAQRRLAYYMMNRHHSKPKRHLRSISHPNLTVVPSIRPELVPNVDSLKMSHLDGGGYGFAIKFPAKSNTEQDDGESGQEYDRPASLQSFEEARCAPAFIEVSTRHVTPMGVVENPARNTPKERSRNNAVYNTNAKNNQPTSTKDLEEMLRLVNGRKNNFDSNYKDDLLAEFDRLNIRRRHKQQRLMRSPSSNHEGPSVNNRSTVDLRMPLFPSCDGGKWKTDPQVNCSPEYEPQISIPSYSSVGMSSPGTPRRQLYQ